MNQKMFLHYKYAWSACCCVKGQRCMKLSHSDLPNKMYKEYQNIVQTLMMYYD